MAKRYLSLEEAAGQLGLTAEQLMKLRERNDIRGFADRGSWKFREQDVEEFLRSQQADSSPDIPIMRDSSSSSVLDETESNDLSSSDSDVRLFVDGTLFDETDDVKSLADSGSDVRLTGDSGPKLEAESDDDAIDLSGWGSDVKLSDSDSDVKLVGAGTEAEMDLTKTSKMSDSDSDVLLADSSDLQLSDSDSDVRLSEADDLGATGPINLSEVDSDSDVKLMGSDALLRNESDSAVKLSTGLDRTDSDIRLAEPSPRPKAKELPPIPDDSDLKLIRKGSGGRLPVPDSGISLEVRGSGIGLDADESGISLEMDSGISLDADDSGISLESFDSGAMLADDSGISLDAGDSGISLDIADDSGISIRPDDMGRTMPMQAVPAAKALLSDSSAMTTQIDVPTKPVGKDSEFELAGLDDDDDDDSGSNTSVLTFEDDGADSSRTVATKAVADLDVEDEVAEDADDEGPDDEFDDSEDLDDVHDAEDFGDEDFESGQSQVGGFPSSTRAASRVDADWGILTKSLIGVSTLLSLLCAVVGIELVRTMWMWTQPGSEAPPSDLLQMFGGLF